MRTNWASTRSSRSVPPKTNISMHWAQALADGARQSQSASVDCVHDIDAAEQLVVDLARNHPDAVVLLKGSHASGLSALAERWAKN